MATETKCPRCNKALPSTAPDGLCPECLMQVAIDSNSLDDPTLASGEKPWEFDVTMSRSGPVSLRLTDELPVGFRLGSFSIERKLGEGGMGTVYEAIDEDTGRRVALKVLKHQLNHPESRKQFLREGQTMASINHPNCVYVFGTDNVDDKLVIAMELVGSDNLQEVIKRNGALTSRQAVDAILQVIDGLEAAAEVGVLHRDIKPANCFVEEVGTIKVGDFGLSISTVGDEQAFISEEDSFFGTPAFASPEQIRGDDLDVRSDIYSVGVTLFQLVTGDVPFTGNNMLDLMSNVLEKPAPMAHTVNPSVPASLSKEIGRCLAKNPDERFRSYAELRAAISSFSSDAPEPAGLPVRLAAGILDSTTASLLLFASSLLLFPSYWSNIPEMWLVSLSFPFVYYLVFESQYGRALGKTIFGLQLIDGERQRPDFKRVLIRTACFTLVPSSIYILYRLFEQPESVGSAVATAFRTTPLLVLIFMFARARRHNGYAALHDWLSDTRVIQRPKLALDISVPTAGNAEPSATHKAEENSEMIGPYHVLQRLGKSDGVANVIGYDRRLLRKVWIREGEQIAEVSPARREVTRPGRQRWLNGFRDGDGDAGWDAWENIEGQPLLQLIRQPQPWLRVRVWLYDLANELIKADLDGTTPDKVGLSNIWISTKGRAMLLDFHVPRLDEVPISGAVEAESVHALSEGGGAHAFLKEVADRSVQGSSKQFQPLPRHAIEILQSLDEKKPLQEVAGHVHRVREKPTAVSRVKRWGMFGAAIAIPAMLGGVVFLFGMFWNALKEQDPLARVFIYAILSDKVEADMENNTVDISKTTELRHFIADEFGDFVRDPERWNSNEVIRALNRQKRVRATAIRITERFSNATPEEIAVGRELFGHLLIEQPKSMPENEAIVANLTTCVQVAIQHDRSTTAKLRRLKVFVADVFGDVILDEASWNSFFGKNVIKGHQRTRLESYVREGAGASEWEIEQARDEYQGIVDLAMSGITPSRSAHTAGRLFLVMIALPALTTALVFRLGLLMWIFQVDCVTAEGKPADRVLMFVRAFLWSVPAALLTFGLSMWVENEQPNVALGIVFICCLIPLWSLVMMRRSLVDCMVGTYLVPR